MEKLIGGKQNWAENNLA